MRWSGFFALLCTAINTPGRAVPAEQPQTELITTKVDPFWRICWSTGPDDPALRARCRQIGDRQRAAVRPDNVFCPWSKGLRHGSTHALDFGNAREMYRPRLKICLNGTLQLDHCRRNAAARPAARCLKSLELVDSRAFGQSLDEGGPLCGCASAIPKSNGIPMA